MILGKTDIEKYLPHRTPFVFVDEVLAEHFTTANAAVYDALQKRAVPRFA